MVDQQVTSSGVSFGGRQTLPAKAVGGGSGGAPVVVVQGLSKIFKDFWMRPRAKAVDDLTFHVNQGEIFGLLGPNGSGKSTTIKIMLGLLKPTKGRVAVFGKPPTEVATKKRIGYLPEESYLYPFLNARETLDYYGKLFGLDASVRTKRIDDLLDMVGLTSVQFRAVREYSKGMQRRIGIAQALINDPELLILDEPTTGLDPIGTRQIKDLILELGRRGKSIILSSHLLADVEDCVDRMIILYGGKKQAEGTCDELLASEETSIIETDRLDDQTVAEIDQVIRKRSGGMSGVGKVTKARQKLEDLFVDIVNRATKERMETSGAKHGGVTAEFLKAKDQEGQALLASLTSDATDALVGASDESAAGNAAAQVANVAKKAADGPDLSVLAGLAGAGADSQASGPTNRNAAQVQGSEAPKPAVDRSMLDSLTDSSGGEKA